MGWPKVTAGAAKRRLEGRLGEAHGGRGEREPGQHLCGSRRPSPSRAAPPTRTLSRIRRRRRARARCHRCRAHGQTVGTPLDHEAVGLAVGHHREHHEHVARLGMVHEGGGAEEHRVTLSARVVTLSGGIALRRSPRAIADRTALRGPRSTSIPTRSQSTQ
jgi:hypothetical protein